MNFVTLLSSELVQGSRRDKKKPKPIPVKNFISCRVTKLIRLGGELILDAWPPTPRRPGVGLVPETGMY